MYEFHQFDIRSHVLVVGVGRGLTCRGARTLITLLAALIIIIIIILIKNFTSVFFRYINGNIVMSSHPTSQ